MHFALKKHLLVIAVLALFGTASAVAKQVIPNKDNLQYSGRIDFSDKNAPSLSWPGTQVRGTFTGKKLAITLDDQWGKNYFNVFIDEAEQPTKIIACQQGQKTYLIADDLASDKVHTFTLFKRTEGEEGRTLLHSLTLSDEGKLQAKPEKPARKIIFYGDSITSGMGNEAPVGKADNISAQKNNYLAYGAITARNLDAEYMSISQSGIGVMISWFDFTMPQFYDQLDAVGNNDSKWNFALWQPDVVVVNLLQNDSWLIDREKRLKPMPSEKDIIKAYKAFLLTLRQVHPDAYMIAALGSMDATRAGSPWPRYVKEAVAQIKQANKDEKITTLFFPFTGFEQHPRVAQHKANADLLTALIKEKMNW